MRGGKAPGPATSLFPQCVPPPCCLLHLHFHKVPGRPNTTYLAYVAPAPHQPALRSCERPCRRRRAAAGRQPGQRAWAAACRALGVPMPPLISAAAMGSGPTSCPSFEKTWSAGRRQGASPRRWWMMPCSGCVWEAGRRAYVFVWLWRGGCKMWVLADCPGGVRHRSCGGGGVCSTLRCEAWWDSLVLRSPVPDPHDGSGSALGMLQLG